MRIIGGEDTGLYFSHSDHLGSTSAMTDSSGDLVDGSDVQYTPFGETRANTELPDITDFGYTGQILDRSSGGLMYYHARYYLPKLRRFVSADTIVPNPGNSQDWNRYSYVRNNPINFVDPSGHVVCPPGASPFECRSAENKNKPTINGPDVTYTTQYTDDDGSYTSSSDPDAEVYHGDDYEGILSPVLLIEILANAGVSSANIGLAVEQWQGANPQYRLQKDPIITEGIPRPPTFWGIRISIAFPYGAKGRSYDANPVYSYRMGIDILEVNENPALLVFAGYGSASSAGNVSVGHGALKLIYLVILMECMMHFKWEFLFPLVLILNMLGQNIILVARKLVYTQQE